MSNKHLSLEPHKIRGREDAWWYEEAKGINMVVEPQEQTVQIVIPWKAIKYALARKEQHDA